MATVSWRISSSALRERLQIWWRRVRRVGLTRPRKRLRLCENLALGERRFVAVVEFESSRFLLGGTGSNLVLLARLGDSGEGREEPTRSPAQWAASASSENPKRGETC